MGSFMRCVLCSIALGLWASVAYAHGSSVFEDAAAHEHAHQHATESDHDGEGAGEIEELHQQLDDIKQHLIASDQRVRVRDILGGIGYIVGITGAAYYYLGRRRTLEK